MTVSLTDGDGPDGEPGTESFQESPFFPMVIVAGALLLLVLVVTILVLQCR